MVTQIYYRDEKKPENVRHLKVFIKYQAINRAFVMYRTLTYLII